MFGFLRRFVASSVPVLCVLFSAASAAPLSAQAAGGAARSYSGPAVKVGDGTARIVVLADDAGYPSAFGLELTADALKGLPTTQASDPFLEWHYVLRFPADAPSTGFDHLTFNWHPHGHIPDKVYTVPHMDFHFYVTSVDEEMAITYAHPGMPDSADVVMPAADLVPTGYIIPPGTQITREGLHALSGSAPELQGKPFTTTMIYGYHKGRLVFVEPMMTIDYLTGRPNATMPMAVPARYSYPGWYPTSYSVTWDAGRQVYRVMMEGLKRWETS